MKLQQAMLCILFLLCRHVDQSFEFEHGFVALLAVDFYKRVSLIVSVCLPCDGA